VPSNNAAYQNWCLMWYGHQPTMSGYGVEREHARQWSTTLLNGTDTQVRFPTEIFDEAASAEAKARVQELIDLYYPNGRPTDYDNWAATFPGVNLLDPNADPDEDGLSNDAERIWGLNPTNAASRNAFTSTSRLASGTFSYTRRSTAFTAMSYSVWTSTNLTTWTQDANAAQGARPARGRMSKRCRHTQPSGDLWPKAVYPAARRAELIAGRGNLHRVMPPDRAC